VSGVERIEELEAGERSSSDQLILACAMIALGGLLLGLQRQADGGFSGTGYASLGMGALIALLPMVFALSGAGREGSGPLLPRTWLSAVSGVCGYAGLAFVAGGVLVPGGPWMFIEALLLLLVLSRRGRAGEIAGVRVTHGTIVWLALFLFARLWVTYQGVRNEWAAIRFEVPLLSRIPWMPAGMRSVSLGDFSAAEFGIPEQGLHFSHTVALWAGGMALCVGGLWWRHRAAVECENDKVNATVHRLPPPLASLIELILPEEEWRELGLHGLNERQRRKRIAALTQERVMRQIEFNRAFLVGRPALPADAPVFVRDIHQVIEGYAPPAIAPPAEPREVEIIDRDRDPR
jgi:hypothetical protein